MHNKVFKTLFVGKYDIERLSVYYEESIGTTEREFCVKCFKWHRVENNLPCYFIRITIRNFYIKKKKKKRKQGKSYESTNLRKDILVRLSIKILR